MPNVSILRGTSKAKRGGGGTRKQKRSSAKVSVPVKQAIVRAVRQASPEEVKFVTSWNSSMSVSQAFGVGFNAGIANGTNYGLIPEITQGTNVGQRIGNKISPKRLVVDFWVNAYNYQSSVDLIARLFILESLKVRDQTAINTAIDMQSMIDYGQAQGPFQGYTSQLSGRVNKDEFRVIMDKTMKIQKTQNEGPTLVNAYVGTQTAPVPNVIHHIRVSLKCPSVLHYATGLNTLPDGWAPFFNCGYCIPSSVFGDSPDTALTRLQVAWTSTLYYTDA